MESVRREPVPVLHHLVHHYHGFHLPDVADRARLELPCGAVTVLMAFAELVRIGLATGGPHGDVQLRGSNRSPSQRIEYW